MGLFAKLWKHVDPMVPDEQVVKLARRAVGSPLVRNAAALPGEFFGAIRHELNPNWIQPGNQPPPAPQPDESAPPSQPPAATARLRGITPRPYQGLSLFPSFSERHGYGGVADFLHPQYRPPSYLDFEEEDY